MNGHWNLQVYQTLIQSNKSDNILKIKMIMSKIF